MTPLSGVPCIRGVCSEKFLLHRSSTTLHEVFTHYVIVSHQRRFKWHGRPAVRWGFQPASNALLTNGGIDHRTARHWMCESPGMQNIAPSPVADAESARAPPNRIAACAPVGHATEWTVVSGGSGVDWWTPQRTSRRGVGGACTPPGPPAGPTPISGILCRCPERRDAAAAAAIHCGARDGNPRRRYANLRRLTESYPFCAV